MPGNYLSNAFFIVFCFLLTGCNAAEKASDENSWSNFYGTYRGSAESLVGEEVAERDLTVTIEPWKDVGFEVHWKTVSHRVNGNTKEADMSIRFYPSERPGIFASAMRTDVFGQSVPYDPIAERANPYVWASIEGNTLMVSAMYIVDGGHEMQVYKRSLNEEGMLLEFDRSSNGEEVTTVVAQLKKVN